MTELVVDEAEALEANRQEVNERYAGDMGEIVVKEMVQNSVDASREIEGAHTQVSIYPVNRQIVSIDQGSGMTADTVAGAFTKFKKSLKVAGASGGKGTAKSAILGKAAKVEMRTVARRDDGQLEETIAWGTDDQYLNPREGLSYESGPLGWVDEAIKNSSLPPGSLTLDELTSPWSVRDNGPVGTGTRLSVVLSTNARWSPPTGSQYNPSPLEEWLDQFALTNHVPGQTVNFEVNEQPYAPIPERVDRQATTLQTTLHGPTWDIDVYVSDALSEQKGALVKIQNNGLYQMPHYVKLPSAAKLPYSIVANLRAKVGAKEIGYPWSADRMRIVAGADEALADYVANTLYGDIIRQQSNELETAIAGGTAIPGGSGRLFNIGRVEGSAEDTLNRLHDEPYMRHLNTGMSALHDRLERLLVGKSWGFYEGGTFGPSEFGGFGISSEWVGLNVALSSLKTRYNPKTEYLTLYDPWALIQAAVGRSRELGIDILALPGQTPATKAATKLSVARSGVTNVTRSQANFKPYADVVTKDQYGNPHNWAPHRLGSEIKWNRQELERAKASKSQSDVDYYGRNLKETERVYNAYLKKVADHLVAKAVLDGEMPVMVDPEYPHFEDPTSTETYYPMLYQKSTGDLWDQLWEDVRRLERPADDESTDDATVARNREEVAKVKRQLEYNRAIEDRILRYQLAHGDEVPVLNVDGYDYALSQDGLDDLANRLSNVTRLNETHYAIADDDWSRNYGRRSVEKIAEELARLQALTGLAPTPGALTIGGGTDNTSMADVARRTTPYSEAFLEQVEGQFLSVAQHEMTHNAVREHQKEAFSRYLTEIIATTSDSETRAIVRDMIRTMVRDDSLRGMFASMPSYNAIKGAENVFSKIGVEGRADELGPEDRTTATDPDAGQAGAGVPGVGRSGDAGAGHAGDGGLPGAGREGRLQPASDLQPGDHGLRDADALRGLPVGGRGLLGRGSPEAGPSAEVGETPELHEFSSTQLDMPPEIAARVRELQGRIDPSDLHEKGLEDDPHVTTKYGLHTNNPDEVAAIAANHGPIPLTLGRTGVFAAGDEPGAFAVVRLDVDSPELRALNRDLSALPNGDSHPEYVPHLTLAYVKPGLGEKYAGLADLEGTRVTIPAVTFSGRDERRTRLGLGSPSPSAEVGETPGPFYSQLERVIDAKMPNRASVEQVKGLLRGAVKPDELVWTTFDSFLADRAGSTITKDEALGYLAQNEVAVHEVLKGGPASELAWEQVADGHWRAPVNKYGDALQMHRLPNGKLRLTTLGGQQELFDTAAAAGERAQEIAEIIHTPDTKFERYSLPGGADYRELLLVLPEPRNAQYDRLQELLNAKRPIASKDRLTTEDYAALKAINEELDAMRAANNGDLPSPPPLAGGNAYTGDHWSEPNVVAHIRFNSRTDADGKPMLFLEEIQSDWHEEGRQKGYARTDSSYVAMNTRSRNTSQLFETREEAEAYRDQLPEHLRPQIEIVERKRQIAGAPQGPFKKTWAELAFKRAIRWAAQNGFSSVGWTYGDVQNDRYSLTEVASTVKFVTKDGATGTLTAYSGRSEVAEHENVPMSKVSDYIGRELADRMLSYEPSETAQGDEYVLQGKDLKVGGSGMRGFYDAMVPTIAAKLGKPFGARVTDTTTRLDATSAVPRYEVRGADGEVFRIVNDEGAAQSLSDQLGGTYAELTQPITVHQLPITEPMRQSAMTQGFPMFQQGAEVPGQAPGDETSAYEPFDDLFDDDTASGLPDDDPFARIPTEEISAIEEGGLAQEIAFPDEPPRTDGPDQLGLVLGALHGPAHERPQTEPANGIPSIGPPVTDAATTEAPAHERPQPLNLALFPAWARKSIERGDLATTRTDVNTRTPLVEGSPDVLVTPQAEVSGQQELPSQALDIQRAIMDGPNAELLGPSGVDALRNAILQQWARLQRAATQTPARGSTEAQAMAAARTLEEARRYTALYALATTPIARWESLESVWKSAPVSEGQGETFEEYEAAQAAARRSGDPSAIRAARTAAIVRAEQLLSSSPRFRAPRGSARNARVVNAASAIGQAVTAPGASPSGVARGMTRGADLSISRLEVLVAMTYNNMLIGPRGILIDWVSNSGQFGLKLLTDPFLPDQGGTNLKARAAITRAEYAALRRYVPVMLHKIGNVLLEGIDDQQANAQGTPHSISGKLTERIADATARRDSADSQAAVAQHQGRAADAVRYRRQAREAQGEIVGLAINKAGAIGMTEVAARLKQTADVGIRALAYGLELTRLAAIQATHEAPGSVDSEPWHARIAQIMDGKQIDPAIYDDIQAKAVREANRTVYQGEMGTLGRKLEKIQRNPAGQMVLPFLRTLYHIRGWAIDLSPLGAAATLYDVARAQIPLNNGLVRSTRNLGGIAGGPYAVAYRGMEVGPAVADLDRRAFANVIGTAAYFGLLAAAFAGNISGSGPPDQPIEGLEEANPDFEGIKLKNTLMATGWRPYSVKVGGYWVSYANWGVLAYILSAAAAVAEGVKYGKPGQNPITTFGRRLFGVAADMSFLQNLLDFYRVGENLVALSSRGPVDETDSEKIKRQRREWAQVTQYGGNILTRYLPQSALLSTIAASQDPHERAIEQGNVRQMVAYRLPEPTIPSLTPPSAIVNWAKDIDLGSSTGRREGLAVRRDVLGHEVPNAYAGIYGWLPFRASKEDLSNPTLQILIDARVGVPSPPSELFYQPHIGEAARGQLGKERGRAEWIQITPPMRMELARMAGERIEQRIPQVAAQWPPDRRAADPDGYTDALATEMKTIYRQVTDEYTKDPVNQAIELEPLTHNSDRRRPVDPKRPPQPREEGGQGPLPDEAATPGVVSTPGPASPTATPQPQPVNPARQRSGEPIGTPRPAAATPRPAATPVPSIGPPLATPSVQSPGGLVRSR
jgi:2'-5' RNA ligase